MTTTDRTYNGWKNYETWTIKLWIDNEQSSQEYWREAARNAWDEASPTNNWSRSEAARYSLANRLKGEFEDEEACPLLADASVYCQLLNAALSEVHWNEVADALLEGVGDYESYRD